MILKIEKSLLVEMIDELPDGRLSHIVERESK